MRSKFTIVLISLFTVCTPFANAQWVTTIAGKVGGYQDGIGDTASFYYPIDVEYDGNGVLYIADYNNNKIRKVDLATRQVSTIAGSKSGYKDTIGIYAKFNAPRGLAFDKIGNNLFVADAGNSAIRKIDLSTFKVSTVAGGVNGYADGVGTNARFWAPFDLEFDSNGYLFVSDGGNHRIRKIDTATSIVTTFAGNNIHGDDDGVGTNARFWFPAGLCYDNNRLYVAGYYNHTIRRINVSTALVTTLAGSSPGHLDGIGTSAKFRSPFSITSDGHGNLYVSDQFTCYIRKIKISTKEVTTIAGNGQMGFVDDTSAHHASFNEQRGIDIDEKGNMYIADWRNHRIRKLTCGFAEVSITTSSINVCPGEPVQLKAKGAETYQWANGLGQDSLTIVVPISDTTYYVTGIDSMNCMASDSISIGVKEIPNKPVITEFSGHLNASSDTTIESYQWLDCNNNMSPIPGATNSVFTPSGPGSYAVRVYRDSCTNTSDCFTLTGIKEIINNREFGIFPNPNNGDFFISSNLNETGELFIFNALGKLVFTQKGVKLSGKPEISVPKTSCRPSIYYLKFNSPRVELNSKFILH